VLCAVPCLHLRSVRLSCSKHCLCAAARVTQPGLHPTAAHCLMLRRVKIVREAQGHYPRHQQQTRGNFCVNTSTHTLCCCCCLIPGCVECQRHMSWMGCRPLGVDAAAVCELLPCTRNGMRKLGGRMQASQGQSHNMYRHEEVDQTKNTQACVDTCVQQPAKPQLAQTAATSQATWCQRIAAITAPHLAWQSGPYYDAPTQNPQPRKQYCLLACSSRQPVVG
jgi:hypothetical protein